jgi:hypothetical protein
MATRLMQIIVMAQLVATVHITGKVVSDTGAPIEHAVVSIRLHTAAGPTSIIRTTTDASGAFAIDLLVPGLPASGAYVADVTAAGFFPLTGHGIAFEGRQSGPGPELRLVLSPIREFAETLNVSPRASPLDLDQNGSQDTLSGAELLDVPFSGAGVKAGMKTLNGVVSDAFGGIHVNGAPESETLFLLDGFEISDPLTGTVDPRVPIEAIRSLTVLSGPYSAEYGRGSAGVVDIVTNTGDDRLRYSATDFLPALGYQKGLRIQSWAPRLTVSGPLHPGRAWFTNGVTAKYNQHVVNELPRGQDTTTGVRLSDYAHAQLNLTSSNILYANLLGSLHTADHVGLGPRDPVSTTLDDRAHQWLVNVRNQQILQNGVVLDVGYGSNRTLLREQPQGRAPYVSTPSGRSGNSYIDNRQTSSRDQVLASVSLPTLQRTHQIKAGLDLERRRYGQEANRGTLMLLDAHGQPIRTISFEGSGTLSASAFDAAAYVQDSWRLRPDTQVQLGVRTDWNGLVRGVSASPRVGIAWSAGARGDIKVSGGYSVTHDVARLQLFTAPKDQKPVSIFYPPYGTGVQPVRTTFIVPAQGLGGLRTPLTQTWTLTWDQRVASNLFLRGQGLRRRQDHGLAYVGAPRTDGDTVYALASQRTEAYDAVEVSARQTLKRLYGWMAGYTRSSARSNAIYRVGPDDYFFSTDNHGPLAWDAPHRFVSWAYLPTFREPWAFATLLEYRTGFPFSAANNAGVVALPANGYRFPAYFSLNVDLERRIRFKGNLWALRAGLTNITNHFNPDSVNGITESANFLQFSGGQRRLLEFRVRWLGRLPTGQ